ncbi:hypothetical protein CK620_10330 [Vandammella animalimorsus]|uniref:Uncharacterized protein n=1 Tax=Vandammella animalimorsus TaxID=2029117 RepID=A0A2A2A894_9BURK|nr:hypothetical protein CK620_10330 [Vandammella animalimorsus]
MGALSSGPKPRAWAMNASDAERDQPRCQRAWIGGGDLGQGQGGAVRLLKSAPVIHEDARGA